MKKLSILLLALCCTTLYSQSVSPRAASSDSSVLFGIQAIRKGFLLPRLMPGQIAHPTPGLIAYNTRTNCLDLFDGNRWVCGDNATADPDRFVFPVMTTDSIEALKNVPQGTVIYDKDKKSLVSFDGRLWQDTKSGGGPWFSRNLYPIGGLVAASGMVLMGSGFTVKKVGPGVYRILLKGVASGTLSFISATANTVQITGIGGALQTASSSGVSILKTYNGFDCRTGDATGVAADRPFLFTAMVKGPRLASSAKRLYPIAGVIDANGDIQSGKGFSVDTLDESTRRLSFDASDSGAEVRTLSIEVLNREQRGTGVALGLDDPCHFYDVYSGHCTIRNIRYRTYGPSVQDQEAFPIAFTAMLSYPSGSAPASLDGRYATGGMVRTDASIRSGDGFSVEKLSMGEYKVTFIGVNQVLSVTANLMEHEGNLRGDVVVKSIEKDGFTYVTRFAQGSDAEPQRRDGAIGFTAIVK